jgi:hypothetical protein
MINTVEFFGNITGCIRGWFGNDPNLVEVAALAECIACNVTHCLVSGCVRVIANTNPRTVLYVEIFGIGKCGKKVCHVWRFLPDGAYTSLIALPQDIDLEGTPVVAQAPFGKKDHDCKPDCGTCKPDKKWHDDYKPKKKWDWDCDCDYDCGKKCKPKKKWECEVECKPKKKKCKPDWECEVECKPKKKWDCDCDYDCGKKCKPKKKWECEVECKPKKKCDCDYDCGKKCKPKHCDLDKYGPAPYPCEEKCFTCCDEAALRIASFLGVIGQLDECPKVFAVATDRGNPKCPELEIRVEANVGSPLAQCIGNVRRARFEGGKVNYPIEPVLERFFCQVDRKLLDALKCYLVDLCDFTTYFVAERCFSNSKFIAREKFQQTIIRKRCTRVGKCKYKCVCEIETEKFAIVDKMKQFDRDDFGLCKRYYIDMCTLICNKGYLISDKY